MDIHHANKAGAFAKVSTEVNKKYMEWHAAVFDDKDSPFDRKTMELIALAASSVIRCSYCVESHSYKAKKNGATEEELAKVIQIASVVGAGSTVSYGVEAFDEKK